MNTHKTGNKTVVVTGGGGYIGHHVVHMLNELGYDLVVIDDLSSGSFGNTLDNITYIEGDFADLNSWDNIKPDVVVHLAASIDAQESIQKPELYFENNFQKTEKLLEILDQKHPSMLIFASTAAVYGDTSKPVSENSDTKPTNPYGESKLLAEKAIEEFSEKTSIQSTILRFFNVAGTNATVNRLPTNEHGLLSKIKKVIQGEDEALEIFGNKFKTRDGTCIRDFVHVDDIAEVVSELLVQSNKLSKFDVLNIGTNSGVTINKVITTSERVTGKIIPVKVVEPREGEIIISIADNTKLQQKLNYNLRHSSIENILKSSLLG